MIRNLGKLISRLIDVYDLNRLRPINRNWRDVVEAQVSRIRTMSLVYTVCLELLSYNRAVYDEHWYRRQMISRQLELEHAAYDSIRVPVVETDVLDLGDMIIPQYVVNWRNMPDEYYILIHLLREFPSPTIKLIDPDTMSKIAVHQYQWLEQIVLTMQDDTALDRIILFVPVCMINKDDQTIYVCYCNVIDTLFEDDFPMDQERFLQFDSLDKLQEFTDKVRYSDETNYIPRNVASGLTSFTKILIRNQS